MAYRQARSDCLHAHHVFVKPLVRLVGQFRRRQRTHRDRYIKAVEPNLPLAAASASFIMRSRVLWMKTVRRGRHPQRYAVGKYGDIYPEGAGKFMKAGSKMSKWWCCYVTWFRCVLQPGDYAKAIARGDKACGVADRVGH